VLGSLSLLARRPLLGTTTTLAVVAAVSGGVALASPRAPGRAATGVEAAAAPVVVPDVPAAADHEGDRAAAPRRRILIAADTHRRARAAAAARDARSAERRRAGARTSRDLHRARLAATDPRTLARALVAQRGWRDTQFRCLDQLWAKESDWQPTATNPTSGAYGIPQALPGRKMATAGADWRTNPATQLAWGLGYIADRYGTPCSAWAHSVSTNWY